MPAERLDLATRLRLLRRLLSSDGLTALGEADRAGLARALGLVPVDPPAGPDAPPLPVLTADAARLSAELEAERSLDAARFDAVSEAALSDLDGLPTGPQIGYLRNHRARFLELDRMAVRLTQGLDAPRLLDVGISVNTYILTRLMPGATIAVAERPSFRMPPDRPPRVHPVDLTDPELDTRDLGERFDLILFAEVLEHLLANPARVLRFLLAHLAPGGHLVVTTPNVQSEIKRRRWASGRNPQPIYAASLGRGQEPAHHVREYTLRELLEAGTEAGGRVAAAFFSACWDGGREVPRPDLRSNLVAVFRAGG